MRSDWQKTKIFLHDLEISCKRQNYELFFSFLDFSIVVDYFHEYSVNIDRCIYVLWLYFGFLWRTGRETH